MIALKPKPWGKCWFSLHHGKYWYHLLSRLHTYLRPSTIIIFFKAQGMWYVYIKKCQTGINICYITFLQCARINWHSSSKTQLGPFVSLSRYGMEKEKDKKIMTTVKLFALHANEYISHYVIYRSSSTRVEL